MATEYRAPVATGPGVPQALASQGIRQGSRVGGFRLGDLVVVVGKARRRGIGGFVKGLDHDRSVLVEDFQEREKWFAAADLRYVSSRREMYG